MEIISRIKEISYDLERTTPETEEYQKELLAIIGRINTWTEGSNSESCEQIKVLRREILWLLNDMKTGITRNEEAIPDMRQHVERNLVRWNQFLGNPRAEGSEYCLPLHTSALTTSPSSVLAHKYSFEYAPYLTPSY